MKNEKKNIFGLPSKQGMEVSLPPKAQLMDARKRLLAEKADPIITRAISIALNDGHPGQMAAMKMCIDRLLPMNEFEARKDGARAAVTITITGVDTKVSNDIVDAEEV